MLVSVVFYVWAGGIFLRLGRAFRPGELGISTFSADFRICGRDLQPAVLGISTFFPGFPHFG